jgi:hypothetical protein
MPKQKGQQRQASTAGSARKVAVPPDPEHLRRTDGGDAFIRDPGDGPAVTSDDLAESLAEGYLRSATSGEDLTDEILDQVVPEEIGGPFVETSAADEFAGGTDGSNPEDADAEPLPRAVSGLVQPPDHE